MSRRSIFHAVESSQMQYEAKIMKINNFNNKIENPLELRLDWYRFSAAPARLQQGSGKALDELSKAPSAFYVLIQRSIL